MIDRNLVRAVVDLAIFFDQSDDDTVDPDAAVAALEGLATNLQAMPHEVRDQFKLVLTEIAPSYAANTEFVEEFAENCGLFD